MNVHVINHIDSSSESLSYVSTEQHIDLVAQYHTCDELIETYDIHGNLLFMTYGEQEC